jgi:hypothetical protein
VYADALAGGFSGVSKPMNMAPFGQQYDPSIYLSHLHLFFPISVLLGGIEKAKVNNNMIV